MRKSNQYRLNKDEVKLIEKYREESSSGNILVIGDLHEPFCLDKYLDFCIEKSQEFDTQHVIFIGDVIDNHYSSYHETHGGNDLMTGGDELDLAIKRIARWYKAFPNATVLIGNHDRLIMRKAQTSAIPTNWIKSYKDVLKVPGWNFVDRYELYDVQFLHGEGGTARSKCRADMQNTVQGHLHTQAYCEHYVGQKFRVYGMQIGCGINFDAYSFGYAKRGKKPAIGIGIITNYGKRPINILMPLGNGSTD